MKDPRCREAGEGRAEQNRDEEQCEFQRAQAKEQDGLLVRSGRAGPWPDSTDTLTQRERRHGRNTRRPEHHP